MIGGPYIAEIAALVGDPARANILAALMDGRALPATELAYCAGVSPQTTSGHLARLAEAHLLSLTKQGRHRYYCLASPLVAHMLEGIMAVAEAGPSRRQPKWKGDEALRSARTCYDHLAGRLGVAIADALIDKGSVVLSNEGGRLTKTGRRFFAELDIDVSRQPSCTRPFCRPCLDWSERRPHLAGQLGVVIALHAFKHKWIERIRDTRAVSVTPAGRAAFVEQFGATLPDMS